MRSSFSIEADQFVERILSEAESQEIRCAVLSGFQDGQVDFEKSDIDIICPSWLEVRSLSAIVHATVRDSSAEIVAWNKTGAGFMAVLRNGSAIFAVDVGCRLGNRHAIIIEGRAFYGIFDKDPDLAVRLVRALKGLYAPKHFRSGLPPEYISLRFHRRSILRRFARSVTKLFEIGGRLLTRRGVFVAVLGTDGSGKSSVLAELERRLYKDRKLIPVRLFHWRPISVGPPRKPVKDPHGIRPHGRLFSTIKPLYLWLLFSSGYWLRVKPLLLRNHIVVFDRYYHDMLVDPRRYRLGGSLRLARLVGRLIPQPDMFIILDVPAKVAHNRKKELTLEETSRQTASYASLANSLDNATLVDGDRPLDSVANDVEDLILSRLAACTKRRLDNRTNRDY